MGTCEVCAKATSSGMNKLCPACAVDAVYAVSRMLEEHGK